MRKNKSVKYLLVTKLPLSLLKSHQKFNDSKILRRQWLPPVSVQIAMYKNNPKCSSIKQHITLGRLGGSSAASTPHLLGYSRVSTLSWWVCLGLDSVTMKGWLHISLIVVSTSFFTHSPSPLRSLDQACNIMARFQKAVSQNN